MGKIYITRHGETKWNIVRRMQGQSDSPLTELGEKQAVWLSKKLINQPIKVIYSSSLSRAISTSFIIKGKRNIEVIACNELREIYLGSWQGRLIQEVEKEFPEKHYCFWNDPGRYVPVDGESFKELVERAGQFFEEILLKHPNDDILIVSHAIVIKALFNYIDHGGNLRYFWEGPSIKPTCLTVLNYENNQLKYELLADTNHYEEENKAGGWFIE